MAVTGSLAPRGVRESVPGKKAMRKDIFKCFKKEMPESQKFLQKGKGFVSLSWIFVALCL